MNNDPRPPSSNVGTRDILSRLFRNSRVNAILAWILVLVLFVVFIESVVDRDISWIGFTLACGVIVLIPTVRYRDWRIMLPWEVLVLALSPILGRAAFGGELGTFAYYLAIAGLALIITVEFHTFSDLQVTHWFAVGLVILTTWASVGAWSIIRWNMDIYLGTSYLGTNAALMEEFYYVTLAGLAAGILFDGYFNRRDRLLRRSLRWVIRYD